MVKSTRHHSYLIVPWIWEKLSWKKFTLVWSEILGLFINTLSADEVYYRRNMQNFSEQFQTPIPQKQKPFFAYFIQFHKWTSNLKHFGKKDESPSLSISGIIDSERGGYLNV